MTKLCRRKASHLMLCKNTVLSLNSEISTRLGGGVKTRYRQSEGSQDNHVTSNSCFAARRHESPRRTVPGPIVAFTLQRIHRSPCNARHNIQTGKRILETCGPPHSPKHVHRAMAPIQQHKHQRITSARAHHLLRHPTNRGATPGQLPGRTARMGQASG